MIDELKVNHKVGGIWIKLNKNNPINEQIIRMMITSYHNVYSIGVYDYNDSVDNMVHDQIKQLVRQSIVIKFTLWFHGNIECSNDRF